MPWGPHTTPTGRWTIHPITHRDRTDMAAWLHSQGITNTNPVLVDALIRLFRNLEKGGDDNGLLPST